MINDWLKTIYWHISHQAISLSVVVIEINYSFVLQAIWSFLGEEQ